MRASNRWGFYFAGICYCASCQEAAHQYRATPTVDAVLAEDGGTDYVLYRKDWVRCVQGGDLFEERRLKPIADEANVHALL
jgi:hypothetical protein